MVIIYVVNAFEQMNMVQKFGFNNFEKSICDIVFRDHLGPGFAESLPVRTNTILTPVCTDARDALTSVAPRERSTTRETVTISVQVWYCI